MFEIETLGVGQRQLGGIRWEKVCVHIFPLLNASGLKACVCSVTVLECEVIFALFYP